jgi:hypothetical protein
MKNYLKYALSAGILVFLFNLPLFVKDILDIFWIDSFSWYLPLHNKLYASIVLTILALVLYAIYLIGYMIIAKRNGNKLIFHLSYVWIIYTIIQTFSFLIPSSQPDPFSISLDPIEMILLVSGGLLNILWGIGFIQLRKNFGKYCLITGIFLIVMGVMDASIILSNLGTLLLIPSWILELIFIYLGVRKEAVV